MKSFEFISPVYKFLSFLFRELYLRSFPFWTECHTRGNNLNAMPEIFQTFMLVRTAIYHTSISKTTLWIAKILASRNKKQKVQHFAELYVMVLIFCQKQTRENVMRKEKEKWWTEKLIYSEWSFKVTGAANRDDMKFNFGFFLFSCWRW